MDNEDIKKRTYRFALLVMKLIRIFPKNRVYWSLGDQLFRSASSIGANIVEATGASSRKDFINFYSIALKSANETKFWLCLARDSGEIKKDVIVNLLEEVEEISNILGASLITLRRKEN